MGSLGIQVQHCLKNERYKITNTCYILGAVDQPRMAVQDRIFYTREAEAEGI